MYTREQLEDKTVRELRQMATGMGITGMSKKRKGVVIDAILTDQGTTADIESNQGAQDAVTGVEFNAVSKLAKGSGSDRTETWCRISSGATSKQFNVAGYTISSVMEFMKEVFNVDSASSPLVNGKEVNSDYVIQGGDNIEFIKKAGNKG